ncbi:hypothetical protein M5K25_020274 [Dendrobium thyrsiflorum]|uniref:GST N-terminal domain-containing protein n=1 Tax=Dendrobium thyrsiflorum TaxID=117978 RepID=A0ABD0U9K9_DENTH
MNPIGKVPVLETPDGPVFESNAIARYVTRLKADNPLYGSSLIEYTRWLSPRLGIVPYNAQVEELAIASLKIEGIGSFEYSPC